MTVTAVFVYGTLKREQLRGSMWPCKPLSIDKGLIQAELYDLGPYPAITDGSGWVLGELWRFEQQHIGDTLHVLDEIEGYSPTDELSLYVRRVVSVQLVDHDEAIEAYTYFAGNMFRPASYRKIEPYRVLTSGQTAASWPDPFSRVPVSLDDE